MAESKRDFKKLLFDDWKVHAACFALVLIAEAIGTQPVTLPVVGRFSLFPMLYVLIIGMILGIIKVFDMKMMGTASPYITLAVAWLTTRNAATVGPNLGVVLEAGPILLAQKLGMVLVSLIAVPIAVLVFSMGRQAVGVGFNTSREDAINIIGSVYGLDSPEGQGVMGGYITGTVMGTVFCAIMANLIIATGIFDPRALAMACGVGSASMMTAYLGSILGAFPDRAEELQAFQATSQVLNSVMRMYMTLFIALPLANFWYKFLNGEARYQKAQAKRAAKGKKVDAVQAAPAKAADTAPKPKPAEKKPAAPVRPLFDFDFWFVRLKIIFISGVFASIGNFISSYKAGGMETAVLPWNIWPLMLFMSSLIVAGTIIDELAKRYLNLKLPSIIYISMLGILCSVPGLSPIAEWYTAGIAKIPLLSICTPILAYAGISLGKDWDSFRQQGVGIIVVACSTFLAIFLGPAIVAQILITVTGM